MARSRRRRGSARPARGPQISQLASIGRGFEPASRRLSLLPRSLPVGLSRRLVTRFARPARTLRSNVLIGVKSRVIRDALREQKRLRKMLRSPLAKRSVCSRRDRRRQVLHARGVAGVSGGAWSAMMRNAHFNSSSFSTCRR